MSTRNKHLFGVLDYTDQSIERWENDGGAHGRAFSDCHVGRRVEADRSWTVYHVFTGAPASMDGNLMTGLSEGAATDGMLWLNRRNEARRPDRGSLMTRVRAAFHGMEDCRR